MMSWIHSYCDASHFKVNYVYAKKIMKMLKILNILKCTLLIQKCLTVCVYCWFGCLDVSSTTMFLKVLNYVIACGFQMQFWRLNPVKFLSQEVWRCKCCFFQKLFPSAPLLWRYKVIKFKYYLMNNRVVQFVEKNCYFFIRQHCII